MEISGKEFSVDELALMRDIILAFRNLRYGSVNPTVHDGRLVEIQKVEKIRMNGTKVVAKADSPPHPNSGRQWHLEWQTDQITGGVLPENQKEKSCKRKDAFNWLWAK